MTLLPLLFACTDPPPPAPARPASASTAAWVEWRTTDEPVSRPVALVVDVPGGPLDRVVADVDVTTFLNDRFHPVFASPTPERAAGTVHFLDACGCPLAPPASPATPAAFIALANTIIVKPASTRCQAPRLVPACSPPPG